MRSVRWLVALVLACAGCDYDAAGQGAAASQGSEASTGSPSPGSGSSTGRGEGPTTTTGADDTGTSGDGPGGGESTSSETGVGSTGDPPSRQPRSCREILAQDPSAATGRHVIVRERDGAEVEVHCDMELDGGGWTLVARSEPGMEGPFGWGVSRGMVGDDRAPYSLDALDLGLPFTEVLIGRRTGFATVIEHAYVVDVPEGFLEDYEDATYETTTVRTVVGDCNPPGGPLMLRRIGHTQSDETYFFRDIAPFDLHGLRSNGLETYFDDCEGGGDLDEEQGALFVR